MMSASFANKHILLGVTGSIAAYKSADLVRRLREQGAIVRVVMTEQAKRFITPLTMQAVSGLPVSSDLFDEAAEAAMGHIELARWADLILIAPATADCLARLLAGRAPDLLSAICLASNAPLAIAPAMNQGMWKNTFTEQNQQQLAKRGVTILGPASGQQACGDVGLGRMLEAEAIIAALPPLLGVTGALAGLNVLITAGPTQEALDPVRYLSNHSSGKMGYALAEAACKAGAKVTLISGPTALQPPDDVHFISVVSGRDMQQAVLEHVAPAAIFIAVAAVCDFRPQIYHQQKLPKAQVSLALQLEPNPDIVSDVGNLPNKPYIVGFAAETENLLANAKAKRERKKMDMIVANLVGNKKALAMDENEVTLITAHEQIDLPKMQKSLLANKIINVISHQLKQRKS